MTKVKFYCVVVNNGDGSASALFYADEETAQKACAHEEKKGEAFTENEPVQVIMEFDDSGKLLDPDSLRDY